MRFLLSFICSKFKLNSQNEISTKKKNNMKLKINMLNFEIFAKYVSIVIIKYRNSNYKIVLINTVRIN